MSEIRTGPLVLNHPDLRSVVWDGTEEAYRLICQIAPKGWNPELFGEHGDKHLHIDPPEFMFNVKNVGVGDTVAVLDDHLWIFPAAVTAEPIVWSGSTAAFEAIKALLNAAGYGVEHGRFPDLDWGEIDTEGDPGEWLWRSLIPLGWCVGPGPTILPPEEVTE